jgi:hypothetical protein
MISVATAARGAMATATIPLERATVRSSDRVLAAVLLLACVALAVQLVLGWDLGLWITDQGRDVVWAESVAGGRQMPRLGPAASGVQLQGPAYYLWVGLLQLLGVPAWRVGMVLAAAILAHAALVGAASARQGSRLSAALAVGLGLGHVGLASLLLTSTNPSWVPLVAAVALATVAGAGDARSGVRAALRFAAAGALWSVAVQLHLSAVVAAPALAVATLLAPRRFRAAAGAGLVGGAGAALLALSGSVSTAAGLVTGLLAHQAHAPAAPALERLAAWLVLPWRMADWWWRHGALGAAGYAGAVLHWAAVLLGVVLLPGAVREAERDRRVWLLVLLAWAAGGLLYPLAARTTAFYYLVGALPALHLAAGCGLARRRWSAWLGALALLGAAVALLDFNRSLAREREWRLPAFALWWADSPLHLPTLRAAREAVDVLGARGVSFDCAVRDARGGAWLAAMMDGGVLASRLLPPGGPPCPGPLLLSAGVAGRLQVQRLGDREIAGWPPAAEALREPTEMARPRLRPFGGVIAVPADGRARTISVLAIDRPPSLACGAPWEPLGLGRFQVRLAGDAPCTVVGTGEPVWVDVAPSP